MIQGFAEPPADKRNAPHFFCCIAFNGAEGIMFIMSDEIVMDFIQSTRWLECHLQNNGVENKLNEQVYEPIRNYALLWNLMEYSAKEKGLVRESDSDIDIVWQVANNVQPDLDLLKKIFEHFSDRYRHMSGSINKNFDALWPADRSTEKRKEIISYLCKSDATPVEMNLVCASICMRYRHNLFHGKKEFLSLHSQAALFNIADIYMESIIDSILLLPTKSCDQQ